MGRHLTVLKQEAAKRTETCSNGRLTSYRTGDLLVQVDYYAPRATVPQGSGSAASIAHWEGAIRCLKPAVVPIAQCSESIVRGGSCANSGRPDLGE
eukprot:3997158-Pleurochrysis_carterae.AAC.4